MRLSLLSSFFMAGSCLAQGDIAALLKSQPDLSTLLELVGFVDGLADTLASASNITIFAPTNQAFANVPRNEPEGEAIEYRNNTIAVGALLANHVFKGVYPSNVITNIPTFAQTLLDISYIDARQPFSNFTGGAYNGLVKNGDDVCVLSGEQTISTVTEADIKLGEGITIHKVDTVLSFGAPFQLFTYRAGYLAINAALEAAKLNIDFGLSGPGTTSLNISDFTIFVPTDAAFDSIGSVLETADIATLQKVLGYHIIPNNVIFSPSLGNVTVPSLQGTNLTFTVLPDGSAWVNNARITFPNTILYNGVAHVIDRYYTRKHQNIQKLISCLSVLAPGEFDRANLKPSAPAPERVAFPNASAVSHKPLASASLAFAGDLMTYSTTPQLLKTVAAIATATSGASITPTASRSAPITTFTGAAGGLLPGTGMALAGVAGVAAFLI
ncbi:hypothetical protein N0V95_004006 [Ascochyta clinopodiicola]|nr:hypothetical protein N0V95_004006 [Ascochyta clinopodiicola]